MLSQSIELPLSNSESASTSEPSGSSVSTRKQPSLLKAAGLIAVVTILSKVLGAVRDWQIMTVYGASLPSDAYFAAAQIPSFAVVLLGGLGGPFHTATVAIFSKLLHDGQDPSPRAKHLANTFVTLTGTFFIGLSILVYVFATPIMGVILQKASPGLIHNAAQQLQIMSPMLFFGGLIGIFYGILNIYHSFFWPSLSPAALSIVMSVALLMSPNDSTGHILAWSTLVGTIAQFAIQLPEYFKRKFSYKPAFDWQLPELRQVWEILLPAVIGTTIGQLTTYVDMFFTATLPVGGWTSVVMGNRLIQLPIGVLQTALLVPIFPRFTRNVMNQEWKALKESFQMGVVSLWIISMPILVCMLLYTEALVRLVFQHGQFDEKATSMVTQVLVFLAFSMLPYFARDSITRVFYAFQDSKTPLTVGMISIITKAFLDWLLVVQLPFGVGGIAFSTTLMTFINMTLLGILSKRHIQDLGFKEMSLPFVKLTLAALVMAFFMVGLTNVMHPTLHGWFAGFLPRIAEILEILLMVSLGMGVYLAAILALKVPEAQYLYERLGSRFKRKLS